MAALSTVTPWGSDDVGWFRSGTETIVPWFVSAIVAVGVVALYSRWRGMVVGSLDRIFLGDLRERASIEAIEAERSRVARDLHDVLVVDRRIVVAREVTKLHEEFMRGSLNEVIGQLAEREIRGEVTLVIEGCSDANLMSEQALRDEIGKLQNGGMRVKEIAEILGEKHGYSKREIYRLALDLNQRTS